MGRAPVAALVVSFNFWMPSGAWGQDEPAAPAVTQEASGAESADDTVPATGESAGDAATAGEEAPAEAAGAAVLEPVQFENSLGMRLRSIEGSPVLFAERETRVRDFDAFVQESGYAWAEAAPFEQGPDHPVVNVNRNDAVVFCQWLTRKELQDGTLKEGQKYRLPTGSEWRDAAAQGLGNEAPRFPWGAAWPPPAGVANLASADIGTADDGFAFTAPVGSFAPAPSGLYDLAGNVWEWCEDRDGTRGQNSPPSLRGGAFNYFRAANLETDYRYEAPDTMRAPTFGFRVVLEDGDRNARFLASSRSSTDLRSATARLREEQLAREAAEREAMAERDRIGAPDAQPEAGQRFVNSLGIQFLPIDGVPFLAGATEVRVSDFRAYGRVAGAEVPKPSFNQGDAHPIVGISWDEAAAFAEWLTARELEAGWLQPGQAYRLPTDDEWSQLAGLDIGNPAANPRHLWGDAWPPPPSTGNFEANRLSGYFDSDPYTSDVGKYAAERNGLFDLSGNAAEWVVEAAPAADGSRTARGGSWRDSASDALESFRRLAVPGGKGRSDVGFRLILDLGQKGSQ